MLSDAQEILISSFSILSATLSVFGSSLIMYMVLRSRQKSSYKRILLGLCASDIVASIAFALRPFLVPADTSQRVWASGTDATCSFLGFLTQFSYCAVWYNGMLSYYYLFTIRYGVSQKVFERRYEPCIHILSLGVSLTTSFLGWGMGWYSEFHLGQGCWISEVPDGCEDDPDLTCYGTMIAWCFAGIWLLILFFSIIINNIVIFRFVRTTTQRVFHKSFEHTATLGTNETKSEGHKYQFKQDKKVKAVSAQAMLYVGCFFITYIWSFILRILGSMDINDEIQLYPLLVLASIFHPLQGLFNLMVYSRPNYLRNRYRSPNQSRWWALKKTWFDQHYIAGNRRTGNNQGSTTGQGSSWFQSTARSGTTEWFVHHSNQLSSNISSIFQTPASLKTKRKPKRRANEEEGHGDEDPDHSDESQGQHGSSVSSNHYFGYGNVSGDSLVASVMYDISEEGSEDEGSVAHSSKAENATVLAPQECFTSSAEQPGDKSEQEIEPSIQCSLMDLSGSLKLPTEEESLAQKLRRSFHNRSDNDLLADRGDPDYDTNGTITNEMSLARIEELEVPEHTDSAKFTTRKRPTEI